MSMDKIIVELFTRVKELEEKVEKLESIIEISKIEDKEVLEAESIKVTRSTSRKYTIDKLSKKNPDFIFDKASRAMGSGIVITDKATGELKKAKFYHSGGYNEDFPASWHTLSEDDVNDNTIDYFIFNLEDKGLFYSFIFTSQEIKQYIKGKVKDQNNKYYFYFQIKNGKVLECRDGDNDVSQYLNRWKIV